MIRILLVPGFVVDTYSEIERALVELCANSESEIEFLWLVPDISRKHNNFATEDNRYLLKEPVWLPHLRGNGIKYKVANISKFNPLANFFLFGRIFEENEIHAVYTHFGFERFWAALLGKLWKKPTIWNEHWYSLGMRYGRTKRLFYSLFVSEFISVSRFIAATLPRRKRVHVVLNSIRAATEGGTGPDKEAARRRLGIKAGDNVVLMVAAFTVQKRHTLALDICDRVLRSCSDVVFIFLGDGRGRVKFLASGRERNFGPHVYAPGYVPNVDDYYIAADVCMLTSQGEGFGYTVLEAMRHRRPVVVFDSGALPELVWNGETGFVVEDGNSESFAEALLRIIEDKELRESLGAKAQEIIEQHFRRDVWVRTLSELLKEIVQRHCGREPPGAPSSMNLPGRAVKKSG